MESLNIGIFEYIYGINLVTCKCRRNKQPTNQDNVYERSKPIASDRELTPEGGIHDLLFNAVLADESQFHSDILVSKALVASAIGIKMDEKEDFSFLTLIPGQIFSFSLFHPILLERRRRRGAVLY